MLIIIIIIIIIYIFASFNRTRMLLNSLLNKVINRGRKEKNRT